MNVDGPLLLGEAPSKSGDRYYHFPLSGAVARTLCTLAGIPPQTEGSTYGRWTWALYDRFECRNVFERYAQATPWSAPRARGEVAGFAPDLYGRVVVCLGRQVQDAVYGALQIRERPDYYEWTFADDGPRGERIMVVTVPHPSGLNRMLNDQAERDRCGETLRQAIERAELAVVRDPG